MGHIINLSDVTTTSENILASTAGSKGTKRLVVKVRCTTDSNQVWFEVHSHIGMDKTRETFSTILRASEAYNLIDI